MVTTENRLDYHMRTQSFAVPGSNAHRKAFLAQHLLTISALSETHKTFLKLFWEVYASFLHRKGNVTCQSIVSVKLALVRNLWTNYHSIKTGLFQACHGDILLSERHLSESSVNDCDHKLQETLFHAELVSAMAQEFRKTMKMLNLE